MYLLIFLIDFNLLIMLLLLTKTRGDTSLTLDRVVKHIFLQSRIQQDTVKPVSPPCWSWMGWFNSFNTSSCTAVEQDTAWMGVLKFTQDILAAETSYPWPQLPINEIKIICKQINNLHRTCSCISLFLILS